MGRIKFWLALGGALAVVSASLVALNLGSQVSQVATSTPAPLPSRTPITAQDHAPFDEGDKVTVNGQVSYVRNAVNQGVSKPISSLKNSTFTAAPIDKENRELAERAEEAREASYPKFNRANFSKPDPVVQKTLRGSTNSTAPSVGIPSATAGFDGVGSGSYGYTVQYSPPDTTMDVSATQIVQAVNVGLIFFNKSGGVLKGPIYTKAMWANFGGDCQNNNSGDATVVYDRLANRWIISQFALSKTNGSYLQCVAISSSDDAIGTYYLYSFAYANFPDYPKLSVWPDAYYTTFNGFGSSGSAWSGSFVCAYDRARMLAGLSATQQCTASDTANGSLLVASIQGSTPPAAGTAAYAMAMYSGTSMSLWRLSVTWGATPTLTKSSRYSVTIPSYSLACGGCVPQKGTTNQLDTLGDRLMYHFVYRNLNGQDTFVASHTASVSGVTAVRWYEFHTSGASLTTYQASTYNPDSTYRWLPAVSMDKSGNIAMVYSSSSSTMYPAVTVAGRLASDALNTLGQGEVTVKSSSGYQDTSLQRWGDYAAMVVDPADDCTFWSSTEYLPGNGSWNWKTWISSFKFPSCGNTVATSYTISGPSQGLTGQASSNFQVLTDGPFTGNITVTPSGAGVSTTPIVLSFDGTSNSQTFTVTPTTSGTVTFTLSNDGGFTDPTPPTYVAYNAATSYTLTGPSSGVTGVASSNFTVTPNGLFTGTITIAVSGGGLSTSIPLTFAASASAQTFTITPTAAGTVSLSPSDSGSLTDPSPLSYSVALNPPVITSVSPSTGNIGSTITISGSNLTSATRVKINGLGVQSFTKVNDSTLTAVVAPGTTSGKVSVTLSNTASTESGTNFTVTYPDSSVTSISPTSGSIGTSITLSGTNLNNVSAVSVAGVSVANFTATSTRLYLSIPPTVSTGSSKVISLTTPNGPVTFSGLTINGGTVLPAITKLSPTSGGAGTAVTITGSNFASAISVRFNSNPVPFVVLTNTSILAAVPASGGSGTVSVVGIAGASTTNKSFTQKGSAVAPTISSTGISPAAVTVGTLVTITGTNLAGVTSITFNGVTVTSFRVISATQVTFVVPSTTSGVIRITTTGGVVSSASVTVY